MPELLLEVGVEELPATFVRKATSDLADHLRRLLGEAGILSDSAEFTAYGTPRRLIVGISNVVSRQEDQTKEQRGPGLKAAYDAEGNPTQALLGFCRSQGIGPGELRNDGQYVWVTKLVPGRPSSELLSELLPKAIRSLTFDKTMRWGAARMRFARPIRWIVAAFDGMVVPFDVEGVQSGLMSRGHRFYSPEQFPASGLVELIAGLRERNVEPNVDVRRATIIEQPKRVANGTPEMSDALIDENAYLTEWPTAITGEFRREYEELPVPVLITAMAKHEKMFPVRDDAGKLTNRFVFIRNSGEDATVRRGAEWVLNARFNDAKFFFDEDKKYGLDYFLEKTRGILFQDQLGTVRQRSDRLAMLTHEIAYLTGGSTEEAEMARDAGKFAKADLSTGLVSELASLQGVIGGEYARREGLPEEVCDAIASQYDLTKATDPTALRLILADQLDKLAGYLGLGLAPSGSSDPFGLRRAATIAIEAAWQWQGDFASLELMFERALIGYERQNVSLDREAAVATLGELLANRYEALLGDARYDLLEAALASRSLGEVADPRRIRFKLRLLERLAEDVPYVQTATRPLNIVAAAHKKGIPFGAELQDVDRERLQSADGEELLHVSMDQDAVLRGTKGHVSEEEDVTRRLLALAEPINRFFDSTMVMAEDENVRYARLTLLNGVSKQLLVAGDWSKIVIEG